MSHPTRPRTRGPAERRHRSFRFDQVTRLEDRQLLAPFLSIFPRSATFTAFATQPSPTATGGNITVTEDLTSLNQATFPSASPTVSVSLLTPISSFGSDIVTIKAGPGGDFGKGVYAISRGAGDNTAIGAINRPGVIYRVDPVTGKSSVFFDLNTVLSQLETGGTAANSVGTSTGFVNWYSLSFDPEGYFNGKPSLFVASVDRQDPNKNVVFQIGPDGSFLGAFASFTDGQAALKFTSNPTAILVPPTEQQSFLRGLFVGSGTGATTPPGTSTFSAFFFNANQYRPGQNISSPALPFGMTQTGLSFGPQTALVSANTDYISPVYSTFTDFGTPSGGGIPQSPGLSGVQGLNGELLINGGVFPLQTDVAADVIDRTPAKSTNFRRFESAAFDYYGYFSQGTLITALSTATTGATFGNTSFAGSLFVADLGTGLSVPITPPNGVATLVPVQGPGTGSLATDGTLTLNTANLGGRIVRIDPNGLVTNFAENFATSGDLGSTSFVNSSLTITFSADGTTLYASDDQGIWQFKSVASLAGSTSGSLVGLNDLRSLGVPYEGQGTAVAVVDTGVDATTPNFRGRVSPGTNIVTNGPGNDDTAAVTNGTGTGTGGTTTGGTTTPISQNGHGTLLAGVIAQFVPQATIVPVDVFAPFIVPGAPGTTTGTGGTGGTGTGITATSNGLATSQNVYQGLQYVNTHPYVKDPVRPLVYDRVITAALGFGSTETFNSEGGAFRRYPQIVIALKNQMTLLRRRGIQPIAAAGQFGAPFASGTTTTGTGGGTGGGGGGINGGANNSGNINVGDSQGISLPAVLNEVISVTGSIPFPYIASPSTTPDKPTQGVFPRLGRGPFLIFGNGTIPGGSAAGTPNANGGQPNNLGQLTNGNQPFSGGTTGTGGTTTGTGVFYSDRILAAANRNITTDYAAPALDIPTFRRRFVGDLNEHNVFQEGGTTLSDGIVTGSYAVVASALDYWTQLNKTGAVVDAYLTQPVGTNVLNYGPKAFKNVKAYNTPDGINSILQWTATPIADPNDGLSQSTPALQVGSITPTNYSRIDVGNAVASIEGSIAVNWLLKHNTFNLIDTNHDGLITAQEVQFFVDSSKQLGLAEAGAMARLLGGTSRIPTNDFTLAGESPDQPDVLQRRFNTFDFDVHGQLKGALTLTDLKVLAKTLLPGPDSFTVVDRQRASTNGYLDNANAARNYIGLQHTLPTYQFVPKSAVAKYKGVSPAAFKVQAGVTPSTGTFPVFELFNVAHGSTISTGGTSQASGTGGSNGISFTAPSTSTSTLTPTASTGTTTTPSGGTATGTGTTAGTGTAAAGTTTTATGSGTTTSTPATTAPTAPSAAPTPVTPTSQAASLLQAVQNLTAAGLGSPSPAGNIAPSGTAATTTTTLSTPTPTSTTSQNGTVLAQATPIGTTSVTPKTTVAPVVKPKPAAKAKSTSFFQGIVDSFKKVF
jgi:hypothetical protein